MSKSLNKIEEMLCDALDEYAKKGELTAGSLEAIDKLTHSLKSVKTIQAMSEYDEDGASYAGPNGNMGGTSGARGRNARRDSMGRYASRDGWRRNGGMSYDGARNELMDHVEALMDEAKDEATRRKIERFKQDLETA